MIIRAGSMAPEPFIVALLLAVCVKQSLAEYLLQTFSGTIGSENYTYYKLSKPGNIRIYLESIEGDADLYVSDKTLKPDFENYEIKSATCGVDEVHISSYADRPVGIGIYGHHFYEKSKYKIYVFVETDEDINESVNSRDGTPGHHHAGFGGPKDDEESLLWTILVGILKIIIDILV